ncbi:hypothetical protein D5086_029434 [Populus alba]|uniref:Uncharacterized protein n=1 Tax=Populus alba TaxID=43335 RepID=A0ACC4ATI4_POPAL
MSFRKLFSLEEGITATRRRGVVIGVSEGCFPFRRGKIASRYGGVVVGRDQSNVSKKPYLLMCCWIVLRFLHEFPEAIFPRGGQNHFYTSFRAVFPGGASESPRVDEVLMEALFPGGAAESQLDFYMSFRKLFSLEEGITATRRRGVVIGLDQIDVSKKLYLYIRPLDRTQIFTRVSKGTFPWRRCRITTRIFNEFLKAIFLRGGQNCNSVKRFLHEFPEAIFPRGGQNHFYTSFRAVFPGGASESPRVDEVLMEALFPGGAAESQLGEEVLLAIFTGVSEGCFPFRRGKIASRYGGVVVGRDQSNVSKKPYLLMCCWIVLRFLHEFPEAIFPRGGQNHFYTSFRAVFPGGASESPRVDEVLMEALFPGGAAESQLGEEVLLAIFTGVSEGCFPFRRGKIASRYGGVVVGRDQSNVSKKPYLLMCCWIVLRLLHEFPEAIFPRGGQNHFYTSFRAVFPGGASESPRVDEVLMEALFPGGAAESQLGEEVLLAV